MGGRGGSSGFGNAKSNSSASSIPNSSEFTLKSPEKLQGTQDQIQQVEQLRQEVVRHYFNNVYAALNPYSSNSSIELTKGMLSAAKQGKGKLAEYMKSHDIFISSANKLAEKIHILNTLTQQSSAEWWIRNKKYVYTENWWKRK